MNNDVDLLGKKPNWRESDLISILFEGLGIFNWECKNSPYSDSEYLFDVVADLASTIFVPLARSVAINNINIEKQNEHVVVAFDPEDRAAVSKLIRRLVSISNPEDIVATAYESEEEREQGGGKRKYSNFVELYSKVSDLVNSRIMTKDKKTFIEELARQFTKVEFNNEIRNIASLIFGTSNADNMLDLVMEKFEIQKLSRWVSTDSINIDNLIVQDSEGYYKILYDADFNFYKMTEISTPNDIVSKVSHFVIKDGNSYIKKESSLLTQDEVNRVLQGNLVVVHDESNTNGLLLLETPQVRLPDGITDGFKNNKGEIIEGVYVARNGYLTRGRVNLDHTTCNFVVWSEDTLAVIIDDLVREHTISFTDPITQKVIEGLPFAPDIKRYYSFEFLRSATQQSGLKTTYVIQEDNTVLIPTGAHQKLVSGYKAIRKLKESKKLIFKPLPDYAYGITKEELFNIFYDMFATDKASVQIRSQFLSFAMSHLSELNGYFLDDYGIISGDSKSYSLGPDLGQINEIIFELSFTNDELLRLIWKDSEGNFLREQTIKKWLKLIYDKITSYNGKNKELLYQKSLLLGLVGEQNFDELNIEADNPEFTINEANLAGVIFKSIQALIGHFTVRLMFLNMIGFYERDGAFNIKIASIPNINKASENLVRYIKLVSPTYRNDRPTYFSTHSTGDISLSLRHLFGICFGNSYLDISVVGVSNNKAYKLRFPVGTLVFAEANIEDYNLNGLIKLLSSQFVSMYQDYTQENLLLTNKEVSAKIYLKSVSTLAFVLINLINRKICQGNYLNDRAKNSWFAAQLINAALKGLLGKRTDLNVGKFRGWIEEFAQNEDYFGVLSFEALEIRDPLDSTQFFQLEITKDDLIGIDFKILGGRKYAAQTFFDIKNELIASQISDTVDLLIDIIETKEGGVAKILPVMDSGDVNLGYQFLIPSSNFDAASKRYIFFPKDRPYWDIDLVHDKDNSIETLKKIVRLMLLDNFAFVVKSEDAEWDDGLVTCIFNRNGFLNIQDFFSGPVVGSRNLVSGHTNWQMIIDNFYSNFSPDELIQWNNRWMTIWDILTRITTNEMKRY